MSDEQITTNIGADCPTSSRSRLTDIARLRSHTPCGCSCTAPIVSARSRSAARLGALFSSFKFQVSSFVFTFSFFAFSLFAQPLGLATDYEWELAVPGRTLFRDRTPVGNISFVEHGARSGIIGKKIKYTGESLNLTADVAFIPGDTLRYFGVFMELNEGERVLSSVVMDGEELPSLWSSLKYMLETGDKIQNTERGDTRIAYRGKSGWTVTFYQTGKDQHVEVAFPAADKQPAQTRSLIRDELSTFKDLIDLTIFELKRQGAQFAPVSSK